MISNFKCISEISSLSISSIPSISRKSVARRACFLQKSRQCT
jgi:hypothetical protein